MNGYVPIGAGVGAGWVDGRVHVVGGPVFAQIERERHDGPLFVEAVRGGRRSRALMVVHGPRSAGDPMRVLHPGRGGAYPFERRTGMPFLALSWQR